MLVQKGQIASGKLQAFIGSQEVAIIVRWGEPAEFRAALRAIEGGFWASHGIRPSALPRANHLPQGRGGDTQGAICANIGTNLGPSRRRWVTVT